VVVRRIEREEELRVDYLGLEAVGQTWPNITTSFSVMVEEGGIA